MVHTRSDIIATLRSRNVRGSLTKMKKASLLELLRETAPPSSPRDVQRQGIYLAPDPEQKQSGGHAYKVDGSLGANHAAKHVHERQDWPSDKAKKQSGSGRGRGDSDYSRFIRAEMKRNGGKMALAAKAWREHKQTGGHFARKDGTVSDAERRKYKHTHDGPNPSDTAPKAPTSAAAKAADPKAIAKQARADRAAASVVAKASATPRVAPKAPARKASATPRVAPKAPARKATPKRVASSRGDQSIFDAPRAASPLKVRRVDKRGSQKAPPKVAAAPAKVGAPTPLQKARDRLQKDTYSDTHLGRFQKFRDEMGVRNRKYPTQQVASAEFQRRKRADAQLSDDMASARQDRENREATDSMARQGREDRATRRPSFKKKPKQRGSGLDDAPAGTLQSVPAWQMSLRDSVAPDHKRQVRQLTLQGSNEGQSVYMTQRPTHKLNRRIGKKSRSTLRRVSGMLDAMIADAENNDPVLHDELQQVKRERLHKKFIKAERRRQAQAGSGPGVDMSDLPDNMTDEQIADRLVDAGIARMATDPIGARDDFERALELDPEYTLAGEYLDTIDGKLQDAHRRLAMAKSTLDNDVAQRVFQTGTGHFWDDFGEDIKDVAIGAAIVGGTVLTGGLADAGVGFLGAMFEGAGDATAEVGGMVGDAVTATGRKAAQVVGDTLPAAGDTSVGDALDSGVKKASDRLEQVSDAAQTRVQSARSYLQGVGRDAPDTDTDGVDNPLSATHDEPENRWWCTHTDRGARAGARDHGNRHRDSQRRERASRR